ATDAIEYGARIAEIAADRHVGPAEAGGAGRQESGDEGLVACQPSYQAAPASKRTVSNQNPIRARLCMGSGERCQPRRRRITICIREGEQIVTRCPNASRQRRFLAGATRPEDPQMMKAIAPVVEDRGRTIGRAIIHDDHLVVWMIL